MVDMHVTRWSPDTCQCVLEYEWDRDLPLDQRTISFTKLIRKCTPHQSITVPQDVYDNVLGENQMKNGLFAHVVTVSAIDLNDPEVEAKIQWTFAGTGTTRVLNVGFSDALTPTQKATAQNWANTEYGAGKVVVS